MRRLLAFFIGVLISCTQPDPNDPDLGGGKMMSPGGGGSVTADGGDSDAGFDAGFNDAGQDGGADAGDVGTEPDAGDLDGGDLDAGCSCTFGNGLVLHCGVAQCDMNANTVSYCRLNATSCVMPVNPGACNTSTIYALCGQ